MPAILKFDNCIGTPLEGVIVASITGSGISLSTFRIILIPPVPFSGNKSMDTVVVTPGLITATAEPLVIMVPAAFFPYIIMDQAPAARSLICLPVPVTLEMEK